MKSSLCVNPIASTGHRPSCRPRALRLLLSLSLCGASALVPVVTFGSLVAFSASAGAQPAVDVGALTEEQRQADERKRLAFIKGEIDPIVSRDAAATQRTVREFLAANPNLHPIERIALYREVGTKLLDASNTQNNQNSPQRAENDGLLLAFVDEGVQEAAPFAALGGTLPRDRLLLQRLALVVLLRQNQLPLAQQRVEATWSEALSDGEFLVWVKLRRDLLLRQGKEAEVAPMIRSAIEGRLQGRHQFDASLCQLMAEVLREQGQSAQSLSWGRLNFMLCPFTDWDTSIAAQTLARTWTYDLSVEEVKAFVTAQSTAGAPNPLQKVALPTLDARLRELVQKAAGTARTEGDSSALISLLLVLGDYGGAMRTARVRLASEMGSEESVRQVARVFKAKDLSLVRANGFLSFYGSGQGTNPLIGFFQDAGAAPVAPPVAVEPPVTAPAPVEPAVTAPALVQPPAPTVAPAAEVPTP